MMRKEMPLTPNTKMKQLQWDKLPHQQVSRTLWKDDEPQKERLMLEKLKTDGVWNEMEEDFKAKQLVINLMARQKRAELKSVLDPQTRKRVGKYYHPLPRGKTKFCLQRFLSNASGRLNRRRLLVAYSSSIKRFAHLYF